MKIPTLLALVILSVLMIGGITLKFYLDKTSFFKKDQPVPQNINLSNLTPTSISISFDTPQAVETQIIYSTDKNLLSNPQEAADDRDSRSTGRLFHFSTLQNLVPNTQYFFKLKVSGNSYPDQPLSFSTPKDQNLEKKEWEPLVGSVIDSNLKEISEALIILNVDDYLPLATFTDYKGGFVLSYKPIYKKDDLAQILSLPDNLDGQLIISKNGSTSTVDIHLSQPTKVLPPIVLGQNLDLRDYTASADASLKQASPTAQPLNFDVNGDGQINSADVTIVSSNIGRKKLTNPKADINLDGVVDQKDLDLIKSALK
jgi:hypothetical protein